MKRILISLITTLFVAGIAASALANHHEEAEAEGAHAQCAHAAGEACPHMNKSEDTSSTQCTKHAKGEECSCNKHEKDASDPEAQS